MLLSMVPRGIKGSLSSKNIRPFIIFTKHFQMEINYFLEIIFHGGFGVIHFIRGTSKLISHRNG